MGHREGEVIVLCPAAVPSCASPAPELCSGTVAVQGLGSPPALPPAALSHSAQEPAIC